MFLFCYPIGFVVFCNLFYLERPIMSGTFGTWKRKRVICYVITRTTDYPIVLKCVAFKHIDQGLILKVRFSFRRVEINKSSIVGHIRKTKLLDWALAQFQKHDFCCCMGKSSRPAQLGRKIQKLKNTPSDNSKSGSSAKAGRPRKTNNLPIGTPVQRRIYSSCTKSCFAGLFSRTTSIEFRYSKFSM